MIRLDPPVPNISPKQSRLRRIWILIIGIGALTGMIAALIEAHSGDANQVKLSQALISDAPISRLVAAILLAALVLTALASVLYYRNIDEHDRSAQEYASLVGLNTYMLLFFGWTVAAKGSLLPPVNHGAVFAAVMATSVVTWLWRRYR